MAQHFGVDRIFDDIMCRLPARIVLASLLHSTMPEKVAYLSYPPWAGPSLTRSKP